jgi:fructose/tagatose bisphosphate aldolase
MPAQQTVNTLLAPMRGAVDLLPDGRLRVNDISRIRQSMDGLARIAATGQQPSRASAQWLIRELAVLAGCLPSSIQDLYAARGAGRVRTDFSVPAMNLRALPYAAARAVFRAARAADAGAFIFEIARSEMGYTDQTPAEYSSAILAAALAEGFTGPVFIQGDHFQVSAKKHAQEPEKELDAVRRLTKEAVLSGFYNIDIDTSTLVDLSKSSVPDQQRLNYTLCASLAKTIRKLQPAGITISVGGEIGEVGGHNSTEEELRAFMDGLIRSIAPSTPGLSKISIQTGTSHGGVVLPDGSIAQVKVDFDTLRRLSRIAREEYGMAGAVQHGASTLPVEAFSRFAESGACEVHLATHFQTLLFEHLPSALRDEMYAYLGQKHSDERKPGQTDDQFFYTARKRALGPFKAQLWDLPSDSREAISAAWERQFRILFDRLNVGGTRAEALQYVRPTAIHVPLSDYLAMAGVQGDVGELAD